jgi:FkbM family methyltransferase
LPQGNAAALRLGHFGRDRSSVSAPTLLSRAVALHNAGDLPEAERLCETALGLDAADAAVLALLGVVRIRTGRLDDGIAALRRSLALRPGNPETLNNLANALATKGCLDDAETLYRAALALRPAYADALGNLATVLQRAGRRDEAIEALRSAVVHDPRHVAALSALGEALKDAGHGDEAARVLADVLRLDPGNVPALNALGNVLLAAGRHEEAAERYAEAVRLRPDIAILHMGLGSTRAKQFRHQDAIGHFREAVRLDPGLAAAWNGLGAACMDIGQWEAAKEAFAQSLAHDPQNHRVLFNLGNIHNAFGDLAAAAAWYRRSLDVDPDYLHALDGLVGVRRRLCDWDGLEACETRLIRAVRDGARGCRPFTMIFLDATPADQRACARAFARSFAPVERLRASARPPGPIRIGYLSADYHNHATAHLIAELIERHDRTTFTVIGYSIGHAAGGPQRDRLKAGFDRFVDLSEHGDQEAAQVIRDHGIDILVDLKGYTRDCRPMILAFRPASVQVNFLGYPGTMGADFIDYIIADPVVVPPGSDADHQEAVVRLPGSYQPNDRLRAIAAATPSREACGLPPTGFVFCCFNNTYKITAAVFGIWMRLLAATPGSVLWLLTTDAATEANLRREARSRGVDPDRLVFAQKMGLESHLARHRLADLFLDTLPCNAHTTASDALWAGLPLVTCRGTTFAGRVAASLLIAHGVPELVVDTPADYEALALALARDPDRLAAIRAKVAANRATGALFDTPRYVRGLERAFARMMAIHRAGGQPEPIDIPPEPEPTDRPGEGTLADALRHFRDGNDAACEAVCLARVAHDPGDVDALHLLGLVQHRRGRHAVAADLVSRALAVRDDATFRSSLGLILKAMGRWEEALAAFLRAVELRPDLAAAYNNGGMVLKDLGRAEEAADAYRRAIVLAPGMGEAHANLGNLHREARRFREAADAYRAAIAVRAGDANAHAGLGLALQALGQEAAAAAAFRDAVRHHPAFAEAYNYLGAALKALGRPAEAVAAYREAIRLRPAYPVAHNNLAAALMDLGAYAAAIDSYHEALRLQPDLVEARYNLGAALQNLGRIEEAIAAYRETLARQPNFPNALAQFVHQMHHACSWGSELTAAEDQLLHMVRANGAAIPPFVLLADPGVSPADHLACAGAHARRFAPTERLRPACVPTDGRIRIGYLSADYHNHATAFLIAELIERHDRAAFSITGYSLGHNEGGLMRERLKAGFDRFVDLSGLGDLEAAQTIRDDGIDILVDLKGYTRNCRPAIPAFRPAPVQVNFLGYPGTMGADFIDYIIGDPVVTPPGVEEQYAECIVRMPDCYQPNDTRRTIAAEMPSRRDCGLPEKGFVFCSFNAAYKITSVFFGIWMRLLAAVPGSVLWLLESNPIARGNLEREATALGIDPARLVFAPKINLEHHLARHQLADLFLDTLPINAHTTASDALWVGLPVLTLKGKSFASRVAASLLNAIGLSDLITDSVQEYEELAVELAMNPQRLAAIRKRLHANRATYPLFDTHRFARNLETAFKIMMERHWAGLEPAYIEVTKAEPYHGRRSDTDSSQTQSRLLHSSPLPQSERIAIAAEGHVTGSLEALVGLTERIEVMDIGAAYIAETPIYRSLLDRSVGHLHAFEGDARHVAGIKAAYGEKVTIHPHFLFDGTHRTVHLASGPSGMTSLLRPDPAALGFFNGFHEFGRILGTDIIATRRLDDISNLPPIDFIKMDIQGAELTVLKNGVDVLRNCVAVQMEVSFVCLYHDQPTFGDVDVWMRSQGFIPHCFLDVKRWSIAPTVRNNNFRIPFNQLLEADIVYVRDPLSIATWQDKMVRRLAMIAHYCFSSPDLTIHLLIELDRRHPPRLGMPSLRELYLSILNRAPIP